MKAQELKNLQTKVEKQKAAYNSALGKKDHIKKTMKEEHGVSSIAEAREKVVKLKSKAERLKSKADKIVEDLVEKLEVA